MFSKAVAGFIMKFINLNLIFYSSEDHLELTQILELLLLKFCKAFPDL